MKVKRYLVWLSPLLFLCVSVFVLAHAAQQNRTFTVAGHPGEIPVAEMGGHSYVEIEALTRLANGSLSFRGNQIVLMLPPPNATPSATPAQGFTKEFLKAGIEQMSVIREWRSTLIGAVQRGVPVTGDWTSSFSDRAQHNVRFRWPHPPYNK